MKNIHRRNFLPAFIVNLMFWLGTLLIIFQLPPEKPLNLVIFFLALILTLSLTLALLLGNTRRGTLFSLLLAGTLVLRVIKEASLLNLILLFALWLTAEIYFSRKSRQL